MWYVLIQIFKISFIFKQSFPEIRIIFSYFLMKESNFSLLDTCIYYFCFLYSSSFQFFTILFFLTIFSIFLISFSWISFLCFWLPVHRYTMKEIFYQYSFFIWKKKKCFDLIKYSIHIIQISVFKKRATLWIKNIQCYIYEWRICVGIKFLT